MAASIVPSTITLSPAFKPSVIIQFVPFCPTTFTGRGSILPSDVTTITVSFSPRVTACCGTRNAFKTPASGSFTRTNMPLISAWSGLGTAARTMTWPVLSSTELSINSRRPLCSYSLPSSKRMLTSTPSLRTRSPASSCCRRRSKSVDDCWIFTYSTSVWRMVAICVLPALTNAPSVTKDWPIMPLMGAVMWAWFTLTCAERMAACAALIEASAERLASTAASYSCLLMASAATKGW